MDLPGRVGLIGVFHSFHALPHCLFWVAIGQISAFLATFGVRAPTLRKYWTWTIWWIWWDVSKCFEERFRSFQLFNLRGSLLLPFFAACATVHESADREIGQHDHVYMEAWRSQKRRIIQDPEFGEFLCFNILSYCFCIFRHHLPICSSRDTACYTGATRKWTQVSWWTRD